MKKIRHIGTPDLGKEPKTPRLGEATKSQNPIFKEVHAKGNLGEFNEKNIADTRDFILEKYGVPENHCVLIPSGEEGRKIRAFSILINKENPAKTYYAEGHTAHAILNAQILEKFAPEIGFGGLKDLAADFDNWTVKKGFLDPEQNGFKSFPEARNGLLGMIKGNLEINGLSEDEVQKISEKNMPSWFLSGDSSKEK